MAFPIIALGNSNNQIIELKNKHFEVAYSQLGVSMSPTVDKMDWNWQLKSISGLSSYDTQVQPTVDGRDIFYNRGNITEQYLYRGNSVEQQFILHNPGAITNDLIIEGIIRSEGSFSLVEGGWNWRKGEANIFLGDVFVFDANGTPLPATMQVSSGTSYIFVSYNALKSATYPVTIDPQIGPDDFVLVNDNTNKRFYQPKIIYNQSLKKIFASWTQYNNTNIQRLQDIYGASFDKTLSPSYVDVPSTLPTFSISGGRPSNSSNYSSATSSDMASCGDTILIVWEDFAGIDTYKNRILKVTATATGTNNDTLALFNDATYHASYTSPINPAVAGNGQKFVAVSTNTNQSSGYSILAQSITSKGIVVEDTYTPVFTSSTPFSDVKIDAQPGGLFYIVASSGSTIYYGIFNGSNMVSVGTITAGDKVGSVDIAAGSTSPLIVWSELSGSDATAKYIIIGSINGGTSFKINPDNQTSAGKPSVAYSPQSNSWLVAWHANTSLSPDPGTIVWAREVVDNSTKYETFAVSKQARTSVSPTVAYDTNNNEFWIAWSGGGNKDQILAQRWTNSLTDCTISMKNDTIRENNYLGTALDKSKDTLITTFYALNSNNDSIYPLDFYLTNTDTLQTSYTQNSVVITKPTATLDDIYTSRNKLFYVLNDSINYELKQNYKLNVYAQAERPDQSNRSATFAKQINVIDVNEPFTIDAPAELTFLEDQVGAYIPFTFQSGDNGKERNSISFASHTIPSFISAFSPKQNPSVPGNGHADAIPRDPIVKEDTIFISLSSNANGNGTFILELTDEINPAFSSIQTTHKKQLSVSLTITPVNDAPSFTAGGNETVLEDEGAQTFSAWATNISAGPADEAGQTLHFHVTTDKPQLFSQQPAINAATGDLTFTTATDSSGLATIRVRLGDDGGTANDGIDSSTVVFFTINIQEVNDAPSFVISQPDVTIDEDEGSQSIANWITAISAGPANEIDQNLTFTVYNDQPGLFLVQPSVDATGTLTYTAADNAFGLANLKVRLKDDGGTSFGVVDTFVVNASIEILPINDAPSFTAGSNQTVFEDAGLTTITAWASNISAGNTYEAGQTLQFHVTTDKPQLFSQQPAISAATGNLTFTPATDSSGVASIRVRLGDDGGTANGGIDSSTVSTFTITILPVNDAPQFEISADPVVFEDQGAVVINNWAYNISAGPPNEIAQNLQFVVTTDNDLLFNDLPTIDVSTGELSFSTAADAFGYANITIKLTDDGGTANGGIDESTRTAIITISPVNDAPTFIPGANQETHQDAGPQTVLAWATQISAGPANESADLLNFEVSADNPTIFATLPVIDAITGNLTYAPQTGTEGIANVRVRLGDDGGTLNGGIDSSAIYSFTITVVARNNAPSFTAGGNVNVLEDGGLQSITWATEISAGPVYESAQELTFILRNDNPALFDTQPTLNPNNGLLTFQSKADVYGTANIEVQLRDNGGTENGGIDSTAFVPFTITITPVNDAPSFAAGSNVTVLEDAGAQTITAWASSMSSGPANESAQTLSFNLSNNNNSLFSVQPQIDATSGDLSFTPAPDQNGTAIIQVILFDNGGTADGGIDASAIVSCTITVTPVNDAPSFTAGSNVTVLEDEGAQTVTAWASNISAGPADETGQALQFHVTADKPQLFSQQPAINAATGDLTFTTSTDSVGVATIRVRLGDDGGTTNGGIDSSSVEFFTITINQVNDAPSFTAGSNVIVLEDAGAQTVTAWASNMSAGPANESAQTLSFSLSNNNNSLFSVQPQINATSGDLSFTPAPNQNGTATIQVILFDNGGINNGGIDSSAVAFFTINITPVNDEPSFTAGGNVSVLEDAGAQTVTAWASNISAGPADETGQALQFHVTADKPQLFSQQPAINAATGDLTFTTSTDSVGVATIRVRLGDDGGTADGGIDSSSVEFFTITINQVNDAPSFTAGSNVTVLEDAGAQTITAWASNKSAGPANESAQTLSFNLSNNNNSLFSVQPQINATSGDLSFTPAPDQNGTATIRVILFDNGGINNGGIDSSAVEIFTITITPVNDAPLAVNSTVSFFEDETYRFSVSNFGFADTSELTDQLDSVSITQGPANGTLYFMGSALSNFPFKLKSAQITELTFKPMANQHGTPYATLSFKVSDNNSTLASNGIQWSAQAAQLQINVINVNDAPFSKDFEIAAREEQVYHFNIKQFAFIDDDFNDKLTGIRIWRDETMPGALYLDANRDSIADQAEMLPYYPIFIKRDDINKLLFLAPEGNCIQRTTLFRFLVFDSQTEPSANWYNANARIWCMNHAPMASNQETNIDQNQTMTFAGKQFGFFDHADINDLFGGIRIVTLPNNGNLKFKGLPVGAGQVINSDSLSLLSFTPAPYQYGATYAQFEFQVKDKRYSDPGWQALFSDSVYTYTIHVTRLNQAPLSANIEMELNMGQTYRFTASDFVLTDEHDTNDTLNAVKFIIDRPQWTLFFNNKIVSNGTVIQANELDLLEFRPYPLATKDSTYNFYFLVQDNNSIGAPNGMKYSETSYSLSIHVKMVNLPPLSADIKIVINEDQTIDFNSISFPFESPDEPMDKPSAVAFMQPIIGGALWYKGQQLIQEQIILIDSLGSISFVPQKYLWGKQAAIIPFRIFDNNSMGASNGVAGSITHQILIDILPVNNSPKSENKAINMALHSTRYFQDSDFAFFDEADTTDALAQVIIMSSPSAGILYFNEQKASIPLTIKAEEIGKLAYNAPVNEPLQNPTLQFKVVDNNASGASNGQMESEMAYLITFELVGINFEPVAIDTTFTVNEDSNLVFAPRMFAFSDKNTSDKIDSIRITSLPQQGKLLFNGIQLSQGQTFGAQQSNALIFVPEPDQFGAAYATLHFMLKDNNSTSSANGTLWSKNQAAININVLPVNDAPVLVSTLPNITANEFEQFQFTVLQSMFRDIDDETLSLSILAENANWIENINDFQVEGLALPESNDGAVITVRATDQQGLWVETSFTVNIARKVRPLLYGKITSTSPISDAIPVVLYAASPALPDTLGLSYTQMGFYFFENLLASTYTVKAANPDPEKYPGLISTYFQHTSQWNAANPITINNLATVRANIEMLNQAVLTGNGTASGCVFLSDYQLENGAIKQGSMGAPLAGIDIVIYKNGTQEMIARTQTGENGCYAFSNLPTGNYTLVAELYGFTSVVPYQLIINNQNTTHANLNFVVYQQQHIILEKEALNLSSLIAYPNPSTGQVNLSMANRDAPLQARVINLQGQVLMHQKFEPTTEMILQIRQLPRAEYLIETVYKNQTRLIPILLK